LNSLNKISVIIPVFNDRNLLEKALVAIDLQILLPHEVVIVDSSSEDEIKAYLDKSSFQFTVIYHKSPKRLFPYEASNLGVSLSSFNLVAFLDTKTIPKENWLSTYLEIKIKKNADVVFGITKYLAKSYFQNLLRDSTYGRLGHETAPGSLISKKDFLQAGPIMIGVRSGGDLEWRNRLKDSKYNCITPKDIVLIYNELPNSLFKTLKQFFLYQMYGAKVNIQKNVKDLFLGLTLIFSAILIPQWNGIVGWEDSPLYLPYITRIYAISLVIILMAYFIINRAIFRGLQSNFILNAAKTIIFIFLFLAIFRWNEVLANWVEESVWYVPNITKIYVTLIFLASILYRGLYFPYRNGVLIEDLFPLRWLQVGFLGLLLDLAKAPGYLLGSIMFPFIDNKSKQNKN